MINMRYAIMDYKCFNNKQSEGIHSTEMRRIAFKILQKSRITVQH